MEGALLDKLFLPSSHIFSYSQLSSYRQCPYAFYLSYILFRDREQVQNAYAQSGIVAHEIFEGWANGKIPLEDLPSEWGIRYKKSVTIPFPPFPVKYREKLFDAVQKYLEEFTGLNDDWEILEVEAKHYTDINGSRFTGIIDLVVRDKKDGGIIIIDHKSKSLTAAKKDKDAIKQLYAYCKFVYEKYGVYPKSIYFHLFKEGGAMIQEDFDKDKYDEVIEWLGDTIIDIQMEDQWDAKYNKFFCQNLCGNRDICETALSMPG